MATHDASDATRAPLAAASGNCRKGWFAIELAGGLKMEVKHPRFACGTQYVSTAVY
ncbi:hypothetical protein I41_07520 [Lacipirellula limnantheis]|uniref:Uncharacterized protein n=1 Tax=Lacipirellula limnantheis TaxID=2528024 RepID=A0A517TTB2_9BACT|nr:hypothetical protein I41_07520 [Lacipirellula limnantheis]